MARKNRNHVASLSNRSLITRISRITSAGSRSNVELQSYTEILHRLCLTVGGVHVVSHQRPTKRVAVCWPPACVCYVYRFVIICVSLILENDAMRTNIVIDDKLMDDALKATGLNTKKEAVEMGLKTLIRLKKQEKIRKFKGKLSWEGDLSNLRKTR